MKCGASNKRWISPALMTGLTAFLAAFAVLPLKIEWAAAPLAFFVLLCLAASFLPGRGFFLPVIARGKTGRPVVAVTFDDGPDPATTEPLLELLKRHDVRAAFFVTGERAEAYGRLITAILEQGHDIGNHSHHHDPLLMLRRSATAAREIDATQHILRRFGIVPLAFRPPVGITNPKLGGILRQRGLTCLTFSCRASDFGNRRIQGMARRVSKKIKSDDILLLHDVRPSRRDAMGLWLREVDAILSGLKDRGLKAVPLSELTGAPVMARTPQQ